MVKSLDSPNNIKVSYRLDVDYSLLVHRSWYPHLQEMFSSEYMKKLMIFLNEGYKIKYISPTKENIFKVFEVTNFNSINVVVLGGCPYPNQRHATGIAYGNPKECLDLHPVAKVIRETIQSTVYEGFKVDHDYTLEEWSKNGVLMLHAALTHIELSGDINVYEVWKNFIRYVIKKLNETKVGIHYLLLGNEAMYFDQYINKTDNFVYKDELPDTAVKFNRTWDTPYFREINENLEVTNGSLACIDW